MSALDSCGLREFALYFRTLADPMRLCIIDALLGKAMWAKDLATLICTSCATTSRHLAVLERQGRCAPSWWIVDDLPREGTAMSELLQLALYEHRSPK